MKLSNDKMKPLTRAEMDVMNVLWDAQRALTVSEIVEGYAEPRPAYTTVATFLQAEAQARRLRDDLGLGDAPVFNPIERLEALGVRIVEVPAPEKFSGTSAMAGDTPLVVLNAIHPALCRHHLKVKMCI